MPTTVPVNTQQVLQMGMLAEKLQQTLQQLPGTTGQQLDQERVVDDEMKRSEIQDMEQANQSLQTDPEASRRGRVRVRKKKSPETAALPETPPEMTISDDDHGHNINVRV
ncbi:MAG: hypothetical protein COV67_03500 [Nitrospinae bacterium CG11_big_fil_rev_8_21_14_0_20_56_8]|nr:MAG: hypothetical protein COV67_03500 [Nitrospinae bacterium CG11_big_fil_rev_8_21_14_0_20_56_8]